MGHSSGSDDWHRLFLRAIHTGIGSTIQHASDRPCVFAFNEFTADTHVSVLIRAYLRVVLTTLKLGTHCPCTRAVFLAACSHYPEYRQ